MTQRIILTRGIPGSGKTYWADNFVKEQGQFKYVSGNVELCTYFDNWVNISRDNLRFALFGKYTITPNQENQVTQQQIKIALESIKRGQSIIISDTNLNPKTQNRWIEFAKQNNLEFEYKDFLDVPFQVCIERDKKRDKQVGKEVILDFHNKYIVPLLPKHYNKNPNK
jgi:predicted kinase